MFLLPGQGPRQRSLRVASRLVILLLPSGTANDTSHHKSIIRMQYMQAPKGFMFRWPTSHIHNLTALAGTPGVRCNNLRHRHSTFQAVDRAAADYGSRRYLGTRRSCFTATLISYAKISTFVTTGEDRFQAVMCCEAPSCRVIAANGVGPANQSTKTGFLQSLGPAPIGGVTPAPLAEPL